MKIKNIYHDWINKNKLFICINKSKIPLNGTLYGLKKRCDVKMNDIL